MIRAWRHAAALIVLSIGVVPFATTAQGHSWSRVSARLKVAGGARVAAIQRGAFAVGGTGEAVRLDILLSAKGSIRIERSDRSHVLVVRPDGGEILDHRHQQLVRLDAEQVRRAAGVWTLFLSNGAEPEERVLGKGRSVVLLPMDDAAPESVWVRLASDSLPSRLELGPDRMVALDLSGWRFTGPPPPARFHLTAPPGYEVVDWP